VARIRFQTDEHLDNAVAHQLRVRSLDAFTTHEAGLRAASDPAHLAAALAGGRVMVTEDDDYLRLHAAGVAHAGIVYFPPESRTIGQMVAKLEELAEEVDAEAMIGRVQYR